MNKFKIYLLIAIFSLMSFIAGLTISEAKASVNSTTSIQAVHNTQGVSYDYVYVNGTRYIVFMSSTGDIEVVR